VITLAFRRLVITAVALTGLVNVKLITGTHFN